jgi:hypothetical protein
MCVGKGLHSGTQRKVHISSSSSSCSNKNALQNIYTVLLIPALIILASTSGKCSRYFNLLQTGRSGESILVWAKISAPVQTSPGTPPSLLYNGYLVFFSGVKQPGSGVDQLPPSSAKVKERVQLYLYSPSGPSWPLLG